MDNKNLSGADKFLKSRKRNSIRHYMLLCLSSIIVFITTYALILPAITAEVGALELFDEVASGGGVVIEEDIGNIPNDDSITDIIEESTELETEETTEELPEGSGLLSDGSLIMVVPEIEAEEEDSLISNIFSTLTEAVVNFTAEGVEGNYVCVYNPETGDFNANFKVDFELTTDMLSEYSGNVTAMTDGGSKTFVIHLPSDIIVDQELLWSEGKNPNIGTETGSDNPAFKYIFQEVVADDGTTSCDLVITFYDSFLYKIKENITGDVTFYSYISKNAYQEDGSIQIGKEELEKPITIDKENIKFEENETINKDVTVVKKGSYNSSDNTLTYTVYVASTKGTNDSLVVQDVFTNTDFLKNIGATLSDIKYEQAVVGVKNDEILEWDNSITSYGESVTIGTDISTNTYYTVDDSGNMTINLPGLTGLSEEEQGSYGSDTSAKKANCYKITYTYKVEPSSGKTFNSDNTAKVEFTDEVAGKIVTDSSTASVTVSGKKIIDKTGEINTESNTITWKITAGDGSNSVAGYELTDSMFSQLTEEELRSAIATADGAPADTADYEILKNADESIAGIKFNTNASSQYVITYSTSYTSQWTDTTIKNDADFKDPDGDTFTGSAQVTIPGSGKNLDFNKIFVDNGTPAENEDQNLYKPKWQTTINVPETGLLQGVVIFDYLKQDNGRDHYYSYDQTQEIISALNTAWGDNITNIQFCIHNNEWWNEQWIDASSLDQNTKYYQFRFTIAKDIAYNTADTSANTITYSYRSTADVTDVNAIATYRNYVTPSGPNEAKEAHWEYTPPTRVIKYGANSDGTNKSEGDTNVTTSDGVVTWIVLLRPDRDNNITSYTITDTLPAGISLKELYIAKNTDNSQNYEAITTTENSVTSIFNNTLNVTYSTSTDANNQNVITLNTVFSDNNALADTKEMFVKLVCQIDDTATLQNESVTYTNAVKVSIEGNDNYGSDSQTMTVTWEETLQENDDLSKDAEFDKENNIIKYSIDINKNAKTYQTSDGESYSILNLKDTLSYQNRDWNYIREVNFSYSSIALYEAEIGSDGTPMVDETTGRLVKGKKLGSDDFAWSYSEEIGNGEWATSYKYLNLTIPNSKALILEYEYRINATFVGGGTHNANVTNSALLSMNNETIVELPGHQVTDEVKEIGTAGQASGDSYYTIYKVDANNYALKLADAVFDFYIYSPTSGSFEYKRSFTTSFDGYVGISAKAKERDEDENIITYTVSTIDGDEFDVAADTLCYFVESTPPDTYKLDTTRHYLYLGSNSDAKVGDCEGYSVASVMDSEDKVANSKSKSDVSKAINSIISHIEFVPNDHTIEHYSEKTNISVMKYWLDALGNSIKKYDGSIKFTLYQVFTDINNVPDTPVDNTPTSESSTEATPEDTVLYYHTFTNNNVTDGKTSFSDDYFDYYGKVYVDEPGNNYATPIQYLVNGVMETLDHCFVFENASTGDTSDAYIEFTAAESGKLTLVFNNQDGVTNNCYIDNQAYAANENNIIEVYLDAGTHIISKNSYCLLFYISFEEGAVAPVDTGWAHSFNNGLNSNFYTITGDQSMGRSEIVHNNETISTPLKMNASANITFDAPSDGTIVMILTNPLNSPVIGAKLDDIDHFAGELDRQDSNGKPIYQLAIHVTKGQHAITRISSTEVLLFYMEYFPDSTDSSAIRNDHPDISRANVTEYGEYTITASDQWVKVIADLPWQKLNEDTHRLEGYYSYFVVEYPSSDYKIQYRRNIDGGVVGGDINIINTESFDNNTNISVLKKWLTYDNQEDSASHVDDIVEFDLYQALNLYEGKTLNTTKTVSHVFDTYDSEFYDITTTSDGSGGMKGPYHIPDQYGTAVYNGLEYQYCLKMESATSIKFNAPAAGTMNLVFSSELPKADDGSLASYGGFGYKLIHNSQENKCSYNYNTDTVTNSNDFGNGTVKYRDEAVVFTVNIDEAGEYEIKNNGQCYLFYMDFTYNIIEAGEDLFRGTYTLSSENNWKLDISNLPRYIRDESNDIIGEYSYYVKEKTPNTGYIVEYTYNNDSTIASQVGSVAHNSILGGSIEITNKEEVGDVALPETGGNGPTGYMATGLVLSIGAGILLIKRRKATNI